ncbi:MAG TPA: hypothetical protein PKN33_16770 [Phycisphaerae bacterium]|nr:hypothetical protein [Phycisphaerae bacterium]
MGFASGSVTFRRYKIVNWTHANIDDAFVEALTNCAFGRYQLVHDESTQIGWVTPQHVLDAEFAGEKIAAGRFAHFAMRLDRNTVPAAIKRSYFEIERLAALEASGRDFLNKRELKEARESANRRAEKEARSGAFRRINSFPIVVDLEKAMLYFGNASNGVNEHMQRLFVDTFDVQLAPLNTHTMAISIAESEGLMRALEDGKPSHWVSIPDGADGDFHGLDPTDCSYLGREFLSWIWFNVETNEGVIRLPDDTDAMLSVVNQANLKCDFELTGAVSVRGDAPARMRESKAALATGKQPTRLGLLLASRLGEWALTLDGPTLGVFGLQIPAGDDDDADKSQILESRCESVSDLCGSLDLLFQRFLRLRLSKEWDAVHTRIAMWIAQFDPRDARDEQRLASVG